MTLPQCGPPTRLMRRRTAACMLLLLAVLLFATVVPTAEAARKADRKAVMKGDREQQIVLLEQEVSDLRRNELNRAKARVYAAQAALETARRKEGFFYTRPQDRATIQVLDEDFRRSLVEFNRLQDQEKQLVDQLKPLYGVVSRQFVQEQKDTIASSISTVQKMSYDNAWYSSLFSIGEAESLSDLIVGFLVQWLVGYIILYPFAVLYYAVWAAPWSVYSFCSSFSDVIPAVVAYSISVFVMCLPLIALGGCVYLILRHHGFSYATFKEQMRAQRDAANQRPHYD